MSQSQLLHSFETYNLLLKSFHLGLQLVDDPLAHAKVHNLFSKPLLLAFNNVKLSLEHLDGFISLHNFNRSTLLESLLHVMPLKMIHINDS